MTTTTSLTLKERGVTKEVLHKISIQQSVNKSTKSIIISFTNLNFFHCRTSVTFTIGTTRERRRGKCYRNDQNIPKIDNTITREMYKLN